MVYHARDYLNSIRFFRQRFDWIHKKYPFSWLDDRFFLEFYFFRKMGYRLNLKNPQTFNEKINWMKLYDRNPLYKQLSDKLLVRAYIGDRVGCGYLNEVIQVVDSPDQINWMSLPQSFVIKTTHGSAWNIICEDKNGLDIEEASSKLNKWLRSDFYRVYREWQYKDASPRIFIEKYIDCDPNYGLVDYRVFCKHGEPQLIQIELNTYTNHTRGFYSINWERLPFTYNYPFAEVLLPKPSNLEEMLSVASRLTQDLHFCRVDFFDEKSKLLISEMTFTPIAGFAVFEPKHYDYELGTLIDLPKRKLIHEKRIPY